MNVTTKFLMNTIKVFGTILWMAVLYRYGIIEIIGDYITAVINSNINLVCYK